MLSYYLFCFIAIIIIILVPIVALRRYVVSVSCSLKRSMPARCEKGVRNSSHSIGVFAVGVISHSNRIGNESFLCHPQMCRRRVDAREREKAVVDRSASIYIEVGK